jgi:hypothetical protein
VLSSVNVVNKLELIGETGGVTVAKIVDKCGVGKQRVILDTKKEA